METHAFLFCLGIKERTEKEKDSRGLDSDCRKASTYDGRHGRIRTQIGEFKYFKESLSSLLSNGSDLMCDTLGVCTVELYLFYASCV